MGYRIVYGKEPVMVQPRRKSSLRLWTAVFALVFMVLVRCCWPGGTEILRQYLLPRETAATAAFRQLAQSIQSGEPAGEAVTAFCREIVSDGLAE